MAPAKAKKIVSKAKPKAAGGPKYKPVRGSTGERYNHGGKC